jgi:hypothetical protein
MNFLLYAENDLKVNLEVISNSLDNVCKYITLRSGKAIFEINSALISHPSTYKSLSSKIIKESSKTDYALLFTNKQYDNNHFFMTFNNKAIISFSGWENLTSLSKNNGVVYFIAGLIALTIDNSYRHDDTTGCIYDYGWNKTAVDLGMRNAYICPSCLTRIKSYILSDTESKLLADLEEILDILGKTSKWNKDIVTYWNGTSNSNEKIIINNVKEQLVSDNFDVFLAHNSSDKPLIEIICLKLKERGLKPWLDIEQIPPGRWFQDVIQDTIKKISSAAIFISNNGLGRWQVVELRTFISQCVERKMPVIPVLLPGVDSLPSELVFLNEFNWVKFKNDVYEDNIIDNLVWGITGKHPKRNF